MGVAMNIGVFGGTFDPIHRGHLAIAEDIKVRLGLVEVFFVPAGQPRLRKETPIATAQQRVQMVRLAIAGKPYLRLSTIEVDRAGPSYMVETMAQLKKQLSTADELFFILGWDSLAQLPQWKDPSELIKLCRLVAVPRPGFSAPDINTLEAVVPGLSQSVILLDTPSIDISATKIRGRVKHGLSIHHLVPEPVERYIGEHKLYIGTTG